MNDSQTGVVTKSYQVNGMFIGYIIENSLWLVCSLLLLFGIIKFFLFSYLINLNTSISLGSIIKSKWLYVTYQTTTFTVMAYDIILVVLFSLDFKSYKVFSNVQSKWPTFYLNAILLFRLSKEIQTRLG